MGRRTVLLVVAVLVAAIGTGLIFAYVNGVDDRALEGQQPVEVLVATAAINSGTTGAAAAQAGSFELRKVAKDSVADGALADITPVNNLVALGTIFPGEQILAAKFGAAGSGSVLPIPTDKMAVSVQLADPARVAGFVQPGSEVAVFLTLAPGPGIAQTTDTIRVLLPRAGVIAVGPTTLTPVAAGVEGANAEALPRAIITLALTQTEAQKVILASQKGTLYFGLLTKQSKSTVGSPLDVTKLLS